MYPNASPIAGDDHFEGFPDMPIESDLFGNDGDPDGGSITFVDPATGEAATGPVTITTDQGGTVVVNPDGTFEYIPPAGFMGEDSFDYSVVDPLGEVDDATVTFMIAPDSDPDANDAPDANDDQSVTPLNTPVSGNALDNDTDPNSDPLTVTEIAGTPVVAGMPTVVMTPSGGTVEIFDDGSYTYTPAENFIGTETLPYTISDGINGEDTATLVLGAYDTPPVAEDDILSTPINTPVEGNVLTNDNAVDEDG